MTYFITGASDGLGLSLAQILLSDGKKVVGLSRTKPKIEMDYIELDLSNEKSIQNAAEEITKTDSAISLVNCVGVMARENEQTFAEIERVFDTNVIGPMSLEELLFETLRKNSGEIVNVISTCALRGDVKQPIYSSSKWALRGFTHGLSERFKGSQARAISFVPGGFISQMSEKIGNKIADPENWMPVEDVAHELRRVLDLPRTMEISEIVINRKLN